MIISQAFEDPESVDGNDAVVLSGLRGVHSIGASPKPATIVGYLRDGSLGSRRGWDGPFVSADSVIHSLTSLLDALHF